MGLIVSVLNFNFVIIHIIHKILLFIKTHMNCHKNNISEFFFKKYNRLFEKSFFVTYND